MYQLTNYEGYVFIYVDGHTAIPVEIHTPLWKISLEGTRCAFFGGKRLTLCNIENENSFCRDSNHQSMGNGSQSLPLSYLTC